jgi:hypothetical protein
MDDCRLMIAPLARDSGFGVRASGLRSGWSQVPGRWLTHAAPARLRWGWGLPIADCRLAIAPLARDSGFGVRDSGLPMDDCRLTIAQSQPSGLPIDDCRLMIAQVPFVRD